MQPDPKLRAAVLAMLKGEVADVYDRVRAEAGAGLMEGDRSGVALPGPDGRLVRVGTVSQPKDTRSVRVDEAAAVAWAKEHMADEVVEVIRPSTLKSVKDQVRQYGGVVVRGEIVPVPWAEVESKPSPVRVDGRRRGRSARRRSRRCGALSSGGSCCWGRC